MTAPSFKPTRLSQLMPPAPWAGSSTINWGGAQRTIANAYISKISADRKVDIQVTSAGTVPVTVTNTSDTVSDFRLAVLALDSGSGLSSGQKMVSFEQVTPGASASVEIVFHHPQGWTGRYEVASASRTPSVALDGAAEGSQP